MKKVFFIVMLGSFLIVSSAKAQFGIQLGYGTEIEKPSIGVSAELFMTERVSFTPSFAFYLPIKEDVGGGDEIKINYWELNGDLHFYLSKNEKNGFYALAGVNYVKVKVNFPDSWGVSDGSDSEVGANLGLGLTFPSVNTTPYFEFKYETVAEGQVVLVLGIRFK